MEMAVSFLVAVLFTILISFGWGKELTETAHGRPVLGAVGFLIVIAGYSWQQQSLETFQSLVFWFIICCFPVLLGGAISSLVEQHKAAAQRERAELRRLDPSRAGDAKA